MISRLRHVSHLLLRVMLRRIVVGPDISRSRRQQVDHHSWWTRGSIRTRYVLIPNADKLRGVAKDCLSRSHASQPLQLFCLASPTVCLLPVSPFAYVCQCLQRLLSSQVGWTLLNTIRSLPGTSDRGPSIATPNFAFWSSMEMGREVYRLAYDG